MSRKKSFVFLKIIRFLLLCYVDKALSPTCPMWKGMFSWRVLSFCLWVRFFTSFDAAPEFRPLVRGTSFHWSTTLHMHLYHLYWEFCLESFRWGRHSAIFFEALVFPSRLELLCRLDASSWVSSKVLCQGACRNEALVFYVLDFAGVFTSVWDNISEGCLKPWSCSECN